MIRELFRPFVEWLFWTRRRAALILIGLIVGIALLVRFAGGGAAAPGHAPAPAGPAGSTPASAATAAQTAAAAPASGPAASPAGPAPAAALTAARAFLAAWVSRAAGRDAAIDAVATPQLAAQVTGPAAALAPATRLDGQLTVTGQATGAVSVSVPTNAGPAQLTVRLTGGKWLAAQVSLAETGD